MTSFFELDDFSRPVGKRDRAVGAARLINLFAANPQSTIFVMIDPELRFFISWDIDPAKGIIGLVVLGTVVRLKVDVFIRKVDRLGPPACSRVRDYALIGLAKVRCVDVGSGCGVEEPGVIARSEVASIPLCAARGMLEVVHGFFDAVLADDRDALLVHGSESLTGSEAEMRDIVWVQTHETRADRIDRDHVGPGENHVPPYG